MEVPLDAAPSARHGPTRYSISSVASDRESRFGRVFQGAQSCVARAASATIWGFLLLQLTSANIHAAAVATNTLQVQLALWDGFLAVDPLKTKLHLTPEFQALSRQPSNSVWTALTDWLNQTFKKEGRVIDSLIVSNQNPRLNKALAGVTPDFDQRVERLAHLTTNWMRASAECIALQNAYRAKAEIDLFQFVGRHVIGRFAGEFNAASPLTLVTADEDDSINTGQLLFRVRNPISAAYVSVSNIVFRVNRQQWEEAGVSPSDVEPLIRRQVGQLWWARNFHRNLDDYFARMGYVVPPRDGDASVSMGIGVNAKTVLINEAGGHPRTYHPGIVIQGSPHLRCIQVGLDTNHIATVLRALYMMLPHRDYQRVSRNWSQYLKPFPLPWRGTNDDGSERILYGTELRLTRSPGNRLAISKWFVNRLELQDRLRALHVVGFGANLLGATTVRGNKMADLYLAPLSGVAAARPAHGATNASAEEAVPDDVEEGVDPKFGNTSAVAAIPAIRGTNVAQRAAEPVDRAAADREPRRQIKETEYRHSIEAGFYVASKEDPRVYAGYTQSGLTANDAIAARVGYQREPFGSINYSHDFLGFDTLGRRWTANVSGFSDFDPNRLIAGIPTKERRSGGSLASQLELFRDWNHHWLRLDISGAWREVTDKAGSLPDVRDRIADGDVGLLYFWRRDGTKFSPNLQLEPHLRAAWSEEQSGWFVQPGLRASTHWLLPWFLEWDLRANGQWSSSETPVSELPSFGGEDSVRGYRVDAGIGRAAWAIQNELWIPLRHDWGWSEGVDRFVRRNILLAAFVDVGGVHQAVGEFSGVKAGAGLGLRLVWQDSFVLRLDWGQALTGGESGRGGSFVYLSVTTRRPLFE